MGNGVGGGGGEGSLAQPCGWLRGQFPARPECGLTGDPSRPAGQEGRDREDGATPKRQPESGSSSVFSCSHGDGEVGATRQKLASVGEDWVRFPRPPYQHLCPRDS